MSNTKNTGSIHLRICSSKNSKFQYEKCKFENYTDFKQKYIGK